MEKKNNAEKTDYLMERIHQNENFQTTDINAWAFSKLKVSSEKLNILELCCGTGKQTAYLLDCFPNATVSVLDTSEDAISFVKKTFESEKSRMHFHHTDIDAYLESGTEKFDLIFCSYGLYYAKDINKVFSRIWDRLNPKGRFMVMGPYGNNNKPLFDDLTSLGVPLPYLVTHSSCNFMYMDVLRFCVDHFKEIHIYTTKNPIVWKSADSVLKYWESSTFYAADKRNAFHQLIEQKIANTGSYRNEKNIMLLDACKND